MKIIQKTVFLTFLSGFAFFGASCADQSTTTKSTIGGAAVGAGVGALIDDDKRGRGALIGGAVGGLGGNIYGREKEKRDSGY